VKGGDALDLPEQTAKEQELRRMGVMRWLGTLENAKRTLLILDNADSAEARQALRELLPKVAACAVLITSRYGGDLGGVRRQELALFTAEEAREYLLSHLHAGLLAQSSGEVALDAVAQEVDHLPLALELVVRPERVFTQTSLPVEVAGAVFVSRTLGAGGLLPTYFLYASIQFDAISRWAVLRSNWPAHTSLWSFLSSASFT
jgi:hypothetical protein